MITLYTEEEFTNSKSRSLLPLRCKYCKQVFYRPKNVIQKVLVNQPHKTLDFCSRKCSRIKSIEVVCTTCNKNFLKQPCNIVKDKHNFCSRSCAGIYNNAHKTKGTSRSKLEKWIEEQLTLLYPSLEVHYNKTDAINGELDIYIPSLKLAFELNGIFHYEPIYGEQQLKKNTQE